MPPNRTICDCFNIIGVEIYRISENRVGVLDVRLEIVGKQVSAFFGQNAQQLLKRLKGGSEVKVHQGLTAVQHLTQIELKISQQWGKVVRIVPAPARQILEIILVYKLKPIYVICQNIDKFIRALLWVYVEIGGIKLDPA